MVTKPRLNIQSKKFMFIIIWNPSGFSVVERLPNDTKMNSTYFVIDILIPLISLIPLEQAIFSRGRAPHQKRLLIHLDNCSVHTRRASTDWFEEQGIRRMPHLPYSSDLAHSDFCLFPTIKEN
jgi:hypothetical protein